MTRVAAVGVDDDLATGEPGVRHRAADHEATGRVHVPLGGGVQPLGGDHLLDDVVLDVVEDLLLRDLVAVLDADEHGVHPAGAAVVVVLDGHLRLAVGPSPAQGPVAAGTASCRASWWAIWIGAGISSGVSSQAKPNIIPWSPAPP